MLITQTNIYIALLGVSDTTRRLNVNILNPHDFDMITERIQNVHIISQYSLNVTHKQLGVFLSIKYLVREDDIRIIGIKFQHNITLLFQHFQKLSCCSNK